MRKTLLFISFMIALSHSVAAPHDGLVTVSQIRGAVRNLALDGNWAELTQLESNFNQPGRITDSGYPMADIYYMGFRDYIDARAYNLEGFPPLEAKIQQWIAAFPQSPAGHIALAEVLQKKMSSIRGGRFTSDLSDVEQAQLIESGIRMGQHLTRHKAVASQNPQWYVLMLAADGFHGNPDGDTRKLLNEGLTRYPHYYRLYYNGAVQMLPRWGGSFPKFDAYLASVGKGLGSDMSDQIYALTFLRLFENRMVDLAQDPVNMDCKRVARGMEKFTSRYPATLNFSSTIYLATLCGQKEIVKRYLPKVGDTPEGSAWGRDPSARRAALARIREQ